MKENLSILDTSFELDVATNRADRAAIVAKLIAGSTPIIGPLLSEIISSVIPNQKLDRIISFVDIFAEKVKFMDKDVTEIKMKTEEFTDLLEDGINQASRALSEERKEYIACLLRNSLTEEALQQVEKKKLLSILNELNDAEIILLNLSAIQGEDARQAFFAKHTEVLEPIKRRGASNEPVESEAFWEAGWLKLVSVGLLNEHRQITHLGILLLRYIDVI